MTILFLLRFAFGDKTQKNDDDDEDTYVVRTEVSQVLEVHINASYYIKVTLK